MGDGRFQDVSATAGLGGPGYNRGVAFADFDGDGLVDVIVSRIDEPARFYRNVTPGAGQSIVFHEPLGTEVQIELPDGRKLYNHATSSVGYASSSEAVIRFGLGRFNKPKQVLVRRPGQPWQRLTVTGAAQ